MQCGILSTIPIPIPIVGLCPVGFWPVGFCPWDFVLWDFVLWDFVRGILSCGILDCGIMSGYRTCPRLLDLYLEVGF